MRRKKAIRSSLSSGRGLCQRSLCLVVTLLMLIPSFAILLLFDRDVNADGEIALTVSSTSETINTGDVITIVVNASSLEYVTRFGPIDIVYDPAKTEFISVNASQALPSFTYTTDTEEEGHIKITAVDELAEETLKEASSDEEREELIPSTAFYSEGETVLFSVSFRVQMTAEDTVDFRIASAFDIVDARGKSLETSIDGELSVPIAEVLSNDATLAALGIDEITMTPPFSSDVFDYSASVNRQVENVHVTAIPNNSWSQVIITGGTNLQYGDNLITVDVTAQDGVTTNTYSIHISKQESYTAEGAGLVDKLGKTYSFVNIPAVPIIPEGFTQTTRIINGYEVPVFKRDGVKEILVYLYDGSEDPGFYFYDLQSAELRRYDPESDIIMESRIVTCEEMPESISIPEEFSEDTIKIDGVRVEGYRDTNGNFICYISDNKSRNGLYRYDEKSKRFYPYELSDKKTEIAYRVVAYIFIAATALEAVIIVTMAFIFNRIVVERASPRPKRV
ncbi:MAG: cadherin-like beta sandwich domain-containing protein [Clostridiales bacterium]|nr:cadherin-like beta sandwich domain-containing protein [Clostridiales bacterium]